MSEGRDRPQLILVTAPALDLSAFGPVLAGCLDAVPVACVRLALSSRDDDRVARAADGLREVAHERDVAVVLEGSPATALRLGLDGVHLPDAARSVRTARADLGADAIVGAFCGGSRHEGMTAGELGADYVSFATTGPEGSVDPELFAWWSEMIEVPVVAEAEPREEAVRLLAPFVDFFAFGGDLWHADDPADLLGRLARVMG